MNPPITYVAIQRWSHALVKTLQGRVGGIILGDLFCQKRMFENEWFEVLELAYLARQLGLQVVFQTPVYNTTNTIEQTTSLIRKLYTTSLVNAVLVHDVGVLQVLSELADLDLWWDRFSFNRDFVPNTQLVNFLMAHRISAVEVIRPNHIEDVSRQGCGVLFYGYGPNVATFGRICYTEYFLNEPCGQRILCSQRQPFIVSADKVPLQYLADGYTLLDKNPSIQTVFDLHTDQIAKVNGIICYLRGNDELDKLSSINDYLAGSLEPREVKTFYDGFSGTANSLE